MFRSLKLTVKIGYAGSPAYPIFCTVSLDIFVGVAYTERVVKGICSRQWSGNICSFQAVNGSDMVGVREMGVL